MMKKTCAFLLTALAFGVILVVLGFLIFPCPDKVMTTEDNGLIPRGTLVIPSANIETLLYPVHVQNGYDVGLWDGGIILAGNAEAFSEIGLWDLAAIEPEGLAMECVSIEQCVQIDGWLVGWRGIIRPEWDVLIVCWNTVYRFRML